VVLLRAPSVAQYDGGEAGFPATRVHGGGQLDARSANARAYRAHLRSVQHSVADGVGAQVQQSYTVASDGFSTRLTADQASQLSSDSRVLLMQKDSLVHGDAVSPADFLGMTGKNGAWSKVGGQDRAGDGVVVADIDSGIWPESRSFAGPALTSSAQTKWHIKQTGTTISMDKARGGTFRGVCQSGESWAASNCSTKVVGARYYDTGYLQAHAILDSDYVSARDGSGHGSHTASTAAGDVVDGVSVDGAPYGQMSGMAPAARVAVYKVLWDVGDGTTTAAMSDIVAAIDDAVTDGADVINYSISGSTTSPIDPVEVAFEGAAEAGVFVSAAGGNTGPFGPPVQHNSPWLTTVAASTYTGAAGTPVPQVAAFSSRGPSVANGGDLLKPDLAAPGVGVLAAVAPPSFGGRDYALLSGTSMATPHITGLAALAFAFHPKWTAMQVKSAMMTSATPVKDAAGDPSDDVFATGAGEVTPNGGLLMPGLFVTSGAQQWRGFLTGQGLDTGTPALAPKDLNGPSLAAGGVVGAVSFARTFTADMGGTWKISGSVPGFTVTSSASSWKAKGAGASTTVFFTFTRTTAPLDEWAKGWVNLTGTTTLRLPVALRPETTTVPQFVTGTGSTGSISVPITPGYTGSYPVHVTGLAKAQTFDHTIEVGTTLTDCIQVPAGSTWARFEFDGADDHADFGQFVFYSPSSCDLPATLPTPLTSFGRQTSSTDYDWMMPSPAAGYYVFWTHAWAAGDSGTPVTYHVRGYSLGASSTLGNLTADPNPVPVTAGQPRTFSVDWSGLDPDAFYLGVLDYDDTGARTFIRITD